MLRYKVLDTLGDGGMGTVYRAHDRLTGQQVALKRVRVAAGASEAFRLALAQEFRTLASLRHPNIISVLDYGFTATDGDASPAAPFFTMDLLNGSQTLLDAAQALSVPQKAALLVQTLQALAYLHRRDIIHRDLKPDNVHVVNQQVRVLDFGLAVARTAAKDDVAGTLGYIAPEVLLGGSVSEAADLYAVGVIAYEMFAGKSPFDQTSAGGIVTAILSAPPDLGVLDAGEALSAVIGRLLAKDPADRYASARETITAFSSALDVAFDEETAAIRESFLQAADFVGRDDELRQLTTALEAARQGRGSTWLVGGESGAGKSRLLDELRTYALVDGALVVRGQALSDGGAPYHLWREALRRLALETPLEDTQARLLKTLAPELEDMLERSIESIEDTRGLNERLMAAIEDLFARQPQPVVVLVEDLQWADDESIALLRRLAKRASALPLLLVGNYRSDEVVGLVEQIPGAHALRLERLKREDIARLSTSMLGDSSLPVVELLERETEGNVFFLVEVVRALAEEAGDLAHIARMTLPRSVLAGGMQRILQRRLDTIPEHARYLVKGAAVYGRQFDLGVLQAFMDDAVRRGADRLDLNIWLSRGSEMAVVEVYEGVWRFTHDKLRETVLANLPPNEKTALHRHIAEAIERVYAGGSGQAARLAHHYGEAGDEARELRYAMQAGDEAMQVFALEDAVASYDRAIELAPRVPDTPLTPLYLRCGRALELKGQYDRALETYRTLEALAEAQHDGDMLLEALVAQGIVITTPTSATGLPQTARAILERTLALARERGKRDIEAKTLWNLANQYRLQTNVPMAREYIEQAIALARELNMRELLAYALTDAGRNLFLSGTPEPALPLLAESQLLLRELNDLPMLTDNLITTGGAYLALNRLDEGLALADEGYTLSKRIGNLWGMAFARMIDSNYYSLSGDVSTAIDHMTESIELGQRVQFVVPNFLTRTQLATLYVNVGAARRGAQTLREGGFDVENTNVPFYFLVVSGLTRLYTLIGDLPKAEHTFTRGQQLLDGRINDSQAKSVLDKNRLDLLFAKGEYEDALALSNQLLDSINNVWMADFRSEVLRVRGMTQIVLKQYDSAYSDLLQVYRIAADFRARLVMWQVGVMLGEVEAARGNHDEAQRWYAETGVSARYLLERMPDDLRADFRALPAAQKALSA